MKKKENAVCVGIIVALVLALAGCGSTSTATSPSAPVSSASGAERFEASVERSYETLSTRLPEKATIAALPVQAAVADEGEYIYTELTLQFINSGKYNMVERKEIDKILAEQDFQLSGMVNDKTAVSVGKFLGAHVIIIGQVQGAGASERLVFRALDVETAKILSMSSERIR